jgi:starvation-inducible DNA-binding protein
MKLNLGLADAPRDEVLRVLAAVLADEHALACQTRGFAWNVVGPQFLFLQPFFREQFRDLEGLVDEVAERMRALGGFPELARHARLAPRPGGPLSAREMLAALLADHEAVVRHLRTDLTARPTLAGPGDRGTVDFLAGLLFRHEQFARRLRASLESPAEPPPQA